MRIIHIVHSMETGGAEKLVAMLCRAQRELGHDVRVHCLSTIGPFGEQLKEDGFHVALHREKSVAQKMTSLYRAFNGLKPDVVHCHNLPGTVVAAIPARLARVPRVIATRHDLAEPPYRWRREIKFAIASRACHNVIAVCEATRQNLFAAHLSPRATTIRIYNGAPPLITQSRNSVSKREGSFLLVHVGRLVADKDQQTLLRAAAIARRSISNLTLWMVGDGPLRTGLEQLTNELGLAGAVSFFGQQSEVGQFLVEADAFIMSSMSEGLPVSLLEAMSMGLPTLVTDVGGMAEVVRLAGCGPIVRASDPHALAVEIIRAANNPADLARWGEAGRLCYLEKFTPAAMVSAYMKLYGVAREQMPTLPTLTPV